MFIELLNNFSGDDKSEIDTSHPEGRAEAAKLVGELLRSGSAVFLEKKIGETVYTYRVTSYNPDTNKLTIRLDSGQVNDPDIEHEPRKKNAGRKGRKLGPYRSRGYVSPETGRTVAIAPRSGG